MRTCAVLSKKRSDFVTVRVKHFILPKGSTLLAVRKRSASDNLATGVGADCANAKISHTQDSVKLITLSRRARNECVLRTRVAENRRGSPPVFLEESASAHKCAFLQRLKLEHSRVGDIIQLRPT